MVVDPGELGDELLLLHADFVVGLGHDVLDALGVRRATVMPLIRENVEIGTNLMTDELASYTTATKEGYRHKTVRHSAGEYVRGDAYTNTIEGFWSQLKRSIDGTHHSVSPKHLQTYLDERTWIWNLRTSEIHPFQLLLSEVSA